MQVLVCGFKGKTNSAKLLLDRLYSKCILKKLYVLNTFAGSKKQLESILKRNEYDLIIVFGQKPNTKSIYLEQKGCYEKDELETDYDYSDLQELLGSKGFEVKLSSNAGSYLCNNLFYEGLKLIKKSKIKTKMVFIHIPSIKNLPNIDDLSHVLSEYLDNIINQEAV